MEDPKKLKKLNVSLPLQDSESSVEGAQRMALLLRPHWTHPGLKHQFFTEGVTNKILSLWHDSTGPDDRLLVRIFGEKTELVINREEELRNWELLMRHGCAPPIYAQFNNGIVYGFVPGDVLDMDTVRDKKISTAIAKCMVKQHMISGGDSGDRAPYVFRKAIEYIANRPTSFLDPDKQRRFEEEYPSKERVLAELDLIEETVASLNSPLVFCHNDLLLKNVVYNSATGLASFIDYEYSGFNHQAFDIADHFSEFPGVENMDYVKHYPDRDFQMDWLKTYLEMWNETNKRPPPTDVDVERLYVQVNKFTPMTHYFWSSWAVIQAAHSSIDFDFLDYGIRRWREYERTKELFFPLQMP